MCRRHQVRPNAARAVLPYGLESNAKEIFCTMGNTIPPPRRIYGVAGEIIKSVQARSIGKL